MRLRSDPFHDEIAIDFPSTGRFVERVREAFVSEGAPRLNEALQVRVCVSPSQAFRGVILPVDLALTSPCSLCGGRGETWAERCTACDGSGDEEIPYLLRVVVPPGIADGARLRMRARTPEGTSVRVEITIAITNG